ncbi:MAG TPA: hypothetical protein VK832_01905, partial [Burkholderiaceae bacterium]|nr:hypothetical protein [Burkholderiaceae bacterium]
TLIDRVNMAAGVGGGYDIYLHNNSANTNGGEVIFTVQNSFMSGGIFSSVTGDTIRVLNNWISTPNAGVAIEQIGGAGNFQVIGNNITGIAGCVVVHSGISPIIANNECEQLVGSTNTEVNNSIIDIIGDTAAVVGAQIINNQVQSGAGVGNPTPVNVVSVNSNTIIGENRFGCGSAQAAIKNAGTPTVLTPGNFIGATCNSLLSDTASTGTTAASPGYQSYFITYKGVNFNSANTDTAIPIPLPPGVSNYQIANVRIANASASISTATLGIFQTTGGSGTILANSVITVTTASANTNNNSMILVPTNANTQSFNLTSVQARVGTAQGSAATGDVVIQIVPLP